MIGVIVVVFFGALLVGIPIGVAVGATAISCVLLNPGMPVSTEYIFRSMVTALDSTTLLAVPLFILSGNLMAKGGISEKLFDFFAYFVGDKTGGLPIAAIVTCLFYGAISGSGPATVAAVGAMTIPILTRLGYDKRFVVGMVATAGGLGVIIPPSLPFIMYGVSSGESVSDLFLSGVIPGCLIALIMSVYTWIYCKKHGEDKAKLKANGAAAGPITLGVRPEHLILSGDEGSMIHGTVDVSEMMGSAVHLHVSACGSDTIMIVPTTELESTSAFTIGSPIAFTFNGAMAHLFDRNTQKNLEV